MRHGYKLGQKKPFFYKLVADLVERDGRGLSRSCAQAQERVTGDAQAGGGALRRDARDTAWRSSRRALADEREAQLDGETAFKLYDTYRLPGRPHGRHRPRARLRRSTWTASMRRWARSRSARAPRASSRPARSSSTTGAKTAFRGYDTLSEEGPRRGALSRRRAGAIASAGRGGHRGPRPHAVLRRIRRPGRRPRRAHQGRHVPHALRGAGHAEDPARRLRPPRRW